MAAAPPLYGYGASASYKRTKLGLTVLCGTLSHRSGLGCCLRAVRHGTALHLTYDLQQVAQGHVDVGGDAARDGVAVAGQAADELTCRDTQASMSTPAQVCHHLQLPAHPVADAQIGSPGSSCYCL